MPPKKKVVAEDGAEAGGDGTFRWTPENERILLLMTMGRHATSDDYHKLVGALPPGTNWNAIRQRFGKLRKEQRTRMEELGWTLPDGAATETPTKTPAKSPKKRTAAAQKGDEGGDAEDESPTKKPRARKPKKETVKEEIEEEDLAGGGGGGEMEDEGVKEEAVEYGV